MEKRETLIEFLDRTFEERVERITREELENKIKELKSGQKDSAIITMDILKSDVDKTTLNSKWIEDNVDNLLALEEFRFTKKINVLKAPAYLSREDDRTLSPIGEEKAQTKAVTVLSYIINNQMDTHYFPEVVNLYAISSSPKVYDKEQVEEILKQRNKVHVLPPTIDDSMFLPTHEIRFLWNPEEIQDMLATHSKEVYNDWKADILSKIESAIDNYQTTFPYRHNYLIRGTNIERHSLIKKD